MKKVILSIITLFVVVFSLNSCVTAQAFDATYHPQELEENLVVVDNVCYVYYRNPTTLFLNSLHIVDGTYYYWYTDRYIPVIFPNWEVWSPHRYFYYDRNRWAWRDRFLYDHNAYRRNHHWNDYRRHHHNPRVTPPRDNRRPHHFDGNRGYNPRQRPNRGSSTRVTVNQRPSSFGNPRTNGGSFNRGFGNRPHPNRGGHFGGRR